LGVKNCISVVIVAHSLRCSMIKGILLAAGMGFILYPDAPTCKDIDLGEIPRAIDEFTVLVSSSVDTLRELDQTCRINNLYEVNDMAMINHEAYIRGSSKQDMITFYNRFIGHRSFRYVLDSVEQPKYPYDFQIINATVNFKYDMIHEYKGSAVYMNGERIR